MLPGCQAEQYISDNGHYLKDISCNRDITTVNGVRYNVTSTIGGLKISLYRQNQAHH
jgi:hypothetical protein